MPLQRECSFRLQVKAAIKQAKGGQLRVRRDTSCEHLSIPTEGTLCCGEVGLHRAVKPNSGFRMLLVVADHVRLIFKPKQPHLSLWPTDKTATHCKPRIRPARGAIMKEVIGCSVLCLFAGLGAVSCCQYWALIFSSCSLEMPGTSLRAFQRFRFQAPSPSHSLMVSRFLARSSSLSPRY